MKKHSLHLIGALCALVLLVLACAAPTLARAVNADTSALAPSDVAARIEALIAAGDTNASELIASNLSSPDEVDVYYKGLTNDQARYVLIEVELDEGTGEASYGVRIYASPQFDIDETDGGTSAQSDGAAAGSVLADSGSAAPGAGSLDSGATTDDLLALDASSYEATLVNGWKKLATSIDVSGCNVYYSDYFRRYCVAAANNPSLFNVRTGCRVGKAANSKIYVLQPYYLTTNASEYASMKSAYEAKVAEALATIKYSWSERAKAYQLYDWLCKNTSYGSPNPAAFTAYGCMVNGVGVCQSYSFALNDLYTRAGLSCRTLLVSTENHAWNEVKIDGSWYHVDATYDDVGNGADHTYFLKSDSYLIGRNDGTHENWNTNSKNWNWDSSIAATNPQYDNYDWEGYNPATDVVPIVRVTMYRLYNPYSGEHLYTASTSEKSNLIKLGWRDEGVAWIAPSASNTPVYRLYNPYSGDHHYTTNLGEYNSCVAQGWLGEGIGFYSDDAKGVTVYRLYNRFLVAGTHHYTTSKNEYSSLGKIGWRQENIGWYGLV